MIKKFFMATAVLIFAGYNINAHCSSVGCPGGGLICCEETTTIYIPGIWIYGAYIPPTYYSTTIKHYADAEPPHVDPEK